MSTATPEDLAAIDRLIKPEEPPERIYGWFNSQLSLARFYGSVTVHGRQYFVSGPTVDDPLVRGDVLQREAREKAARLKSASKADKLAAQQAQGGLL